MSTRLEKRLGELDGKFNDYQDEQKKLQDTDDKWWNKPGGMYDQLVGAFVGVTRRIDQLEANNDKLRRLLTEMSDKWTETTLTIKIDNRRS